ncbi:MAG: sigma factor G inhibitor Gin [Bacillota bacterium]
MTGLAVDTVSLGNCLFCGCAGGYGDGILLRGRFICGPCERELINTGCDSIFYSFYVNGLKNIWRCPVD